MKFLGLLLLVAGLGFAVTRVTDLKSVISLPKAAGRGVVSTWELIYGGKNYKSPVTAKGNYADFKIVDGSVKDFTDRFDIAACKLDGYVVKGPATVAMTNGSFSFNQNGFIVSGTLDSVTSRLENYPVPECGSGAKVKAGPFTYKVSWQ